MQLGKKISNLERLACKYYRWIHATRISLAFLITFIVIRYFKLDGASYALITMLIVMGPQPYWGNVFSRALQRTGGTVLGALSGLVSLYLEMYSFPLMLLWCAVMMFVAGYLTLGKHPYMALLIGATLAVVSCAPPNDMESAITRSLYVLAGSLLAMLYTSIYPQRAYTDLRIKFSESLGKINSLYSAYFSPRVPERPELDDQLKDELDTIVKLRNYMVPASNESNLKPQVFGSLQTLHRNLLATMSLMIDAYWSSRESHLLIESEPSLNDLHNLIPQALESLQNKLCMGISNNQISGELRQKTQDLQELVLKSLEGKINETPFYAYVWLSLEMLRQLTELNDQLHAALYHNNHRHLFKNGKLPDEK
ncbi:FUSC family protein [Pseudomonas kulmbachensis]|uniref:FUSC family protein n=1 Tax=Pseudomonas kulmbachensis TaxID=3043408 RepID=UPI002AB19703|nr:FUSC family protein [Pseudomonas sp. FLM 004-28]